MGAFAVALAVIGLSLRGPSVSELRRILTQRGVSTTGVFEREELLRLLQESVDDEALAPPQPIEAMHVQDVMAELDARGIGFDVLTPTPVLYERLRASRRGEDTRGRDGSAKRSRRQQAPPTSRRPKKAYHQTSAPAGWADGVDPESMWNAAQRDLFPLVVETMGAAVEHLKPVAKTAVAATSAPRKRLVERLRARLRRVQVPPKPLILAACVGALRFGVVQTLLAAVSLQLTIDIAREGTDKIRAAALSARREERQRDNGIEQD